MEQPGDGGDELGVADVSREHSELLREVVRGQPVQECVAMLDVRGQLEVDEGRREADVAVFRRDVRRRYPYTLDCNA